MEEEYDGNLKSEEELKELYRISDNVTPYVAPEEPSIPYAPRGKFYRTSYVAPDVDRDSYILALHQEAVASHYSYYAALNSDRIKHIDRNDSLDFYTTEMRRVIPLFLDYYGKGKLFVINGFRSPGEIGIYPHSVGIAMDIAAQDKEQADRIMNAAYMAGIPTIIPGGRFESKEGYVHLDIAPKASYIYDAGYYEGPWS